MKIDALIEKRKLRRKVEGIAAALLPFEADGAVAVEAFQRHLVATRRAGLMNAVNMDTGYVNYLSDAEKLEVLRWTREALAGETPIGRLAFPGAFVAGAYIEGQVGDVVALYRRGGGGGCWVWGGAVFVSSGRGGGEAGGGGGGAYRADCR